MKVIKRDKKKEDFDIKKILKAVEGAFESQNLTTPQHIIKAIEKEFAPNKIKENLSVEMIQDFIEELLMKTQWFSVAKAFILYREKHKELRSIEEKLDYMDYYSSNKDASTASLSNTDPNSNVAIKNVANLNGEVYKDMNRTIQRERMKRKLTQLFGEDMAKSYIEDLNNHIIYTHDESSFPTLMNYCMAVTLYPLMLEGVGNMDKVTPTPPNDIQSFAGQFTNLVFLLSSQVKGAVAFSDFFIALNYYVKQDAKDTFNIDNWIKADNKELDKKIIKGMKQVIWGVNQPAGNRSFQSPY